MTGRAIDLPAEFGSPLQAAKHIADLKTRAQRYDYFIRIPANFQPVVKQLAIIEIATAIANLAGLEERRDALSRVPDDWFKDARSHVGRLWKPRKRVEATA